MNEKILCDGTQAGPQSGNPHQAFVCLGANETPHPAPSALLCPVLDVTVKMPSVGMWRGVKQVLWLGIPPASLDYPWHQVLLPKGDGRWTSQGAREGHGPL